MTPQNGVFDADAKSTIASADLSLRFATMTARSMSPLKFRDDAMWPDSTAPDNIEVAAWNDDALEIF